MRAFDKVSSLTKEELIELLKELRDISKRKDPANHKQSKNMKELFKLENNGWWSDQFVNVESAIKIEILDRIRKDNW